MTEDPRFDASRYRPLGLVANPFRLGSEAAEDEIGIELEITAAANSLVAQLAGATDAAGTKPIVVSKTNDVPSFYHLRAIGHAERTLINDESLDLLHGYIQLYMMRRGRVRATLSAFGERLAFRSFDQTMIAYMRQVLAQPDASLASYQVLGPEALSAFAEAFEQDPDDVFTEYFGEPILERRPELAELADIRVTNLDVDAEETDVTPEIDNTVGDAPGTGVALPEQRDDAEEHQSVVDYLIEYTSKHMSPVIARALRVYRERGIAAVSSEFRVTKAPRKTLAALVKLALTRFSATALLFDGFDSWVGVPADVRQSVVGTMTEMRWMLDGQTTLVFLLEDGRVPELDEAFSAGTRVRWDFPYLARLQSAPDELDAEMVGAWLAAAVLPGAQGLSMDDPVLSTVFDEAGGSLTAFVEGALAAIESAAERGLDGLDELSLEAARIAHEQEERIE